MSYQYMRPSTLPEDYDVTRHDIWLGLKENTTSHGIPHVTRARGPIKRGFWITTVAITVVALLANVGAITWLFAQYPVTVTITLLHSNELVFPAVTMCNMSPVRKSAVQNSSALDQVVQNRRRRRRRSAGDYSCDSGWNYFNQHCYYVSTSPETQDDARTECQGLGADLVSILDQAEQDFVESITYDVTSGQYWMGFHQPSSSWAWFDGESVSFLNWAAGEPDGSGPCARLAESGVWRDRGCGANQRYVCKKAAYIVTTIEVPTTTVEITTDELTTTSIETTSEAATTASETTETPSTQAATTPAETTQAKTTQAQTTQAQTTQAQTTQEQTTQAQTTHAQTTQANTSPPASTDSSSPPTTTEQKTTTVPAVVTSAYKETMTPTEEPETHGDASCCCTCCFQSTYYSDSCTTCADHTVADAASCAASKYPPDLFPIPTSGSTIEEEPDPQPVEGSKFPERVETRESFKEEEKLTELLADVNDTEKANLGTKAADLILDCQYAGYNCYLRDFAQFHNPIHGNCYIFNSGWNESLPLKKSHRAGRRHGLHLTVNIDQDEYVKEVGDTAGLRLVVHPQDRMPFPEDEGITIETGHSTSIGIRQVIIEREGFPYGNCRDPSSIDHSTNVFQEMYPVRYSTTSCTKTCYQQYVISKCGCADPEVPLSGKAFGKNTILACDSSNIEQDDCKYEVNQLYNQNMLKCDCPTSCKDMDYQLEVSTGVWPSNVQKTEVLQKLAPQVGNIFSDPSNPEKYKENLIKLEVYYEEFNFEQITERPSYPPQNYLSDLGGVFGLWLGMSILTLFEFIEFLLDLTIHGCAGRKSRNRVKSADPPSKKREAENIGGTQEKDTKTFANTLPPASHAFNGKQWSKSSNPFAKSSKRQSSRETLMTGLGDSFELENASPPPPYTSRVGSGASSSSSKVSQRRSRTQPKATTRPPITVEESEEITESYLMSV